MKGSANHSKSQRPRPGGVASTVAQASPLPLELCRMKWTFQISSASKFTSCVVLFLASQILFCKAVNHFLQTAGERLHSDFDLQVFRN